VRRLAHREIEAAAVTPGAQGPPGFGFNHAACPTSRLRLIPAFPTRIRNFEREHRWAGFFRPDDHPPPPPPKKLRQSCRCGAIEACWRMALSRVIYAPV